MKPFFFQIVLLLFFFILRTSAYNKISRSKKLIVWNENDYEKYQPTAQSLSDELRTFLKGLVTEFGKSWCMVAPPKAKPSLVRKINLDIPGDAKGRKDFEQVTDFARSSFVIQDKDQLDKLFQKISQKYGQPKSDKNNFVKPKPSGYMDRNLVFESQSHKIARDANLPENKGKDANYFLQFEVQLHLCNIMLVKEIEHLFYEMIRLLEKVSATQKWSSVLSQANSNDDKWKKLADESNAAGSAISSTDWAPVNTAYTAWTAAKDDTAKAEKLVQQIRTFSNGIYKKAMADYAANKGGCDLSAAVTADCKVDEHKMKQLGLDYLKKIWSIKV